MKILAGTICSALILLSACAHSRPETNLKHYQLTGRVVAIDKPNKSLTVDGDEIPGFMSAMQMPYDVKEASLLDRLTPGDKISADLVVNGEDSWLENIKVMAPAAKPTSKSNISCGGMPKEAKPGISKINTYRTSFA